MRTFRSIEEIPANFGPSVVTIGNFDGVHRGHQAVIADVIERARLLGARSVAITFDPHPARVLRPDSPLRLIGAIEQKLELFAKTGLDAALVLPFTRELSRLTARAFAETVLCGALGAIEVQEGENFRFGADACADIHDLALLGRELGFSACVHRPVSWRSMEVSSSRVRSVIANGDMRATRQMLGRPFEIASTPAPGRGYGSRYTVPTINLAPYRELVPANGVYITCLEIGGEAFQAVTNVGNRPTFGGASFAIESHLLNFHPIALDETAQLRLRFFYRIRAEMKFASPQLLKEQIERDIRRARHYFAMYERISRERG